MYAITVNVSYTQRGSDGVPWDGGYGLPTFYLDESVQGIVTEDGAKTVAMGIVNHQSEPSNRTDVRYHITAVKV